MTEPIKLLDHGYLQLIEVWGSDQRIIEAARMSTNKGFLGWGPKGLMCPATGCGWQGTDEEARAAGNEHFSTLCPRCVEAGRVGTGLNTVPGDEKLLRHLWTNNHATPFEMAGVIVEIQAPILVFREWHRHRTQGYSEMSARYVPLPDFNYVPSIERLLMNAESKSHQAATLDGIAPLSDETTALHYQQHLRDQYAADEAFYQHALRLGVPKELARAHLPVGRYSRMRAHANLRNWLAFLTLRMAKGAQWEIRQYANALHDLLAEAFPRTLALFDETR